jgi:hypothetical protein
MAEELFSATHNRLFGLSMTVDKEEFERYKKDMHKFHTMSAIGVCFSAIMTKIVTDDQLGPVVKQHGVSFFGRDGEQQQFRDR